jgi:hypothetical protein
MYPYPQYKASESRMQVTRFNQMPHIHLESDNFRTNKDYLKVTNERFQTKDANRKLVAMLSLFL